MNPLNYHARYYYSNLRDDEKDSGRLSNLSKVTYPINDKVWLKPTPDFKAQFSLHHTILSNTPKNWPEREKTRRDEMLHFLL